MEVMEAPKVQPSAFYRLLCDETEHEAEEGTDIDPAAAPTPRTNDQVRDNYY